MSKFSNMKFRTKLAVGATIAATSVAAAGGAFAYFTGSGTGTGTTTTASGGSIAITLDSLTGLAPGAGAIPVNFKLTASGADTRVHTATVTLPTAQVNGTGTVYVTTDGTTPNTACQAAWFSLQNATQTIDQTVNTGAANALDWVDASKGGTNTATITMGESGTDQSACQSSTVFLRFASASS
jgi:hypothetical protein